MIVYWIRGRWRSRGGRGEGGGGVPGWEHAILESSERGGGEAEESARERASYNTKPVINTCSNNSCQWQGEVPLGTRTFLKCMAIFREVPEVEGVSCGVKLPLFCSCLDP